MTEPLQHSMVFKSFEDDPADFTLVASDGASFSVHSHILRTSSGVLNRALSLPASDHSVMEMPESGDDLRYLIQLFYGQWRVKSYSYSDSTAVLKEAKILWSLCRKYDAPRAHSVMEQTLRSHVVEVNESSTSWATFVLASQTGNVDLAAFAMMFFPGRVTAKGLPGCNRPQPRFPNNISVQEIMRDEVNPLFVAIYFKAWIVQGLGDSHPSRDFWWLAAKFRREMEDYVAVAAEPSAVSPEL